MSIAKLLNQASGGRVVRTAFMPEADINRRELQYPDVKHLISGGFPQAERVVLTLYPEYIPNVSDPVEVWEISGDFPAHFDAIQLRQKLLDHISPEELGDVQSKHGVYRVAVVGKAIKALADITLISGIEVEMQPIDLSSETKPSKVREVVVPSMRVDVVGAKGFGVSRAYFQAGLENKKVKLNGQIAKSSSDIRQGDILSAEGMGKIEFVRVINETRRGNFKVEVIVSKL